MQSVATTRATAPPATRHRFYERLSFEETFWGGSLFCRLCWAW
ncbi:MAG: hypothetical protein R3E79_04395 [Caldilineaceae bacterium]